MQRILLIIYAAGIFTVNAQQVYLNEIRANDASTDDSEFIELVGPAGTDISGWQIEHINGSGGALIFTYTFPEGTIIPDDGITDSNGQSIGFIVAKRSGHIVANFDYEWGATSLQNGPDGIVLYNNAGVRQQALTWNGLSDLNGGDPPWRDIGSDQNDDNSLSAPDSLFEIYKKQWEYVLPTPGMLNTNQTSGDISLPVELSLFRAIGGDSMVKLIWITQAELDNQGFIIERSLKEDTDYILIATYESVESLRGAGNSSEKHQYTFIDNSVFNDITYWYRLIDVSMDGIHTVHPAISVTPKAPEDPVNYTDDLPDFGHPADFCLYRNYPNPFNPTTKIDYQLPISNYVELSIYNMLGEKVVTLISEKQEAGYYQAEWNATEFSSGIYYYQLKSGNFYDVKKMILLR